MVHVFKIGEEYFKFQPSDNLTKNMLDYIESSNFRFYVKDEFKIYSKLDILEKLIKELDSSLDKDKGDKLLIQFLNRLPKGEYFGLYSSYERKIPEYKDAVEWLRSNGIFEEDKQAQEAFYKLLLLRDYYNGDRNPGTYIYCICNIGGAVCAHTTQSVRHVLAFKDPETRDLFLKEQKDLILTAKNLI